MRIIIGHVFICPDMIADGGIEKLTKQGEQGGRREGGIGFYIETAVGLVGATLKWKALFKHVRVDDFAKTLELMGACVREKIVMRISHLDKIKTDF